MAVFKGFAGNRIVDGFLLVAQWQFYREFAIVYTGRVWLDRNLGATRVAASSTDTEARGYYYQWGRNDDGHEFSLSTTQYVFDTIIRKQIQIT
jgi:hypothetical protein